MTILPVQCPLIKTSEDHFDPNEKVEVVDSFHFLDHVCPIEITEKILTQLPHLGRRNLLLVNKTTNAQVVRFEKRMLDSKKRAHLEFLRQIVQVVQTEFPEEAFSLSREKVVDIYKTQKAALIKFHELNKVEEAEEVFRDQLVDVFREFGLDKLTTLANIIKDGPLRELIQLALLRLQIERGERFITADFCEHEYLKRKDLSILLATLKLKSVDSVILIAKYLTLGSEDKNIILMEVCIELARQGRYQEMKALSSEITFVLHQIVLRRILRKYHHYEALFVLDERPDDRAVALKMMIQTSYDFTEPFQWLDRLKDQTIEEEVLIEFSKDMYFLQHFSFLLERIKGRLNHSHSLDFLKKVIPGYVYQVNAYHNVLCEALQLILQKVETIPEETHRQNILLFLADESLARSTTYALDWMMAYFSSERDKQYVADYLYHKYAPMKGLKEFISYRLKKRKYDRQLWSHPTREKIIQHVFVSGFKDDRTYVHKAVLVRDVYKVLFSHLSFFHSPWQCGLKLRVGVGILLNQMRFIYERFFRH